MSNIHYFQRYTQKENVATNNTLLLFSRLYQNSPLKFKYFFNEILDEVDFESGIQFVQQLKNKSSIPDGIIMQDSFKLVIETKLNSKSFNSKQLKKHLESFNDESFQILLALSPNTISKTVSKEIEELVNEHNLANKTFIKFIEITFKKIVSVFKNVINEYDFELMEIINDFEDYCNSSNLINETDALMRVIPCGGSLKENIKNSIYYAPSNRGFSEHSYLGLYNNKTVKAIGKLSNIIVADFNEHLNIKQSLNPPSEKEKENIINIIADAKTNNNWDISKKHTFFCVEKFTETNFSKKTKYALQKSKFFNLITLLGLQTERLPAIEELAALMKTKKW